jgi:AcrR family transcriptional regulator
MLRPPSRLWDDDPSETQQRLILAAVDCIGARGFEGTTTRHLAGRAGVSAATIYNHFHSKQDMLYAICLRANEVGLDLIRRSIDSTTNPTNALFMLIKTFTEFHALEPNATKVANHEISALSKSQQRKIMTIRHQASELVEQLLIDGVAAGEFEIDDTHLLTNALLSLGTDTARWYSVSGRYSPEQIGERYALMALRLCGVNRIQHS